MPLAPIGLSTYARVDHLKETIEALRKNPLAPRSKLVVFSDGPKPGDEEKVSAVRTYLKSVDGFAEITVLERAENNRVFNNREGIRNLLDEHGSAIILEEDVVTAPSFLDFMNAALVRYKDDQTIFSISGYSPPFKLPASLKSNTFVLPRFSAWGFGIWKDRFDRIRMKIDESEYLQLIQEPKRVSKFAEGGWDLPRKLYREVSGEVDALDIKIMYQQFLYGMHTLYPTISLTHNTGHDGSGLHSQVTQKYAVDLTDNNPIEYDFPTNPKPDGDILKAHAVFRDPGLRVKTRLTLKIYSSWLRSKFSGK